MPIPLTGAFGTFDSRAYGAQPQRSQRLVLRVPRQCRAAIFILNVIVPPTETIIFLGAVASHLACTACK